MTTSEQDILLPLKSSDKNPDDWPEFKLTKVNVTVPKQGRAVSLLSAHHSNPVKVTGKLAVIDNDKAHLGTLYMNLALVYESDRIYTVKDKRYRDKVIELDQCTTYAFAQYDDDTCGFWAAGKAGWFEIQSPASSYKAIYREMNEAATIFYLLADKHKKSHLKKRNLEAKAVHKYADHVFQDVKHSYVTQAE